MSSPRDLVLSSGFLAFARHAGFLAAIEELRVPVDGVCGTSSGALAGALWASGMSAREVLAEMTSRTPLQWAALHRRPWRGLFSLDPVIEALAVRLPRRIEDLPRPFGAGVVDGDGRHRLLTSGPLPEAVAASCAVPWLFTPVSIGGEILSDGAIRDRTALSAWRALRPEAAPLLHLIERSAGAQQEPDLRGLVVVRSPRSEARLWSHGDVAAMFERSRALALDALSGAAS